MFVSPQRLIPLHVQTAFNERYGTGWIPNVLLQSTFRAQSGFQMSYCTVYLPRKTDLKKRSKHRVHQWRLIAQFTSRARDGFPHVLLLSVLSTHFPAFFSSWTPAGPGSSYCPAFILQTRRISQYSLSLSVAVLLTLEFVKHFNVVYSQALIFDKIGLHDKQFYQI